VADTLRKWDLRVSKNSVAMTIAHFFTTACLQELPLPQGLTPMERINYLGTGTPTAERLRILDATIKKLQADFGTWVLPWGEVSRFQRLTGEIEQVFDDTKPSLAVGMASGNWGALASFGARGNTGTKKLYGTYGNSFVAVVEFGPQVYAKSLLAGGQSSDPASPHFMDQARRYVDAQFKDVAFYREDVIKRAEKKYHPGMNP
jgi:acyl-homoserine lactone acylase PvdQ